MTIYLFLFYTFSCLSLLTTTLVVISQNTLHSALFLVLSFCNMSSLLFMLSLEFLPVSFLIVYVGAILVIFLFVIMMLNVKVSELRQEKRHYIPATIFIGLVYLFELFLLLQGNFVPIFFLSTLNAPFISDFITQSLYSKGADLALCITCEHNTSELGSLIFVDYYTHFIVGGFVLLLAMVAVIVLTLLKRFVSKPQNVYAQVLRDFNSAIVFYS